MTIVKQRYRFAVLISLLLFGAVLLPRVPTGRLELRISDLTALGIVPLVVLAVGRVRRSRHLPLLFLLWLVMGWSTLYGYAVLSVPPSLRDLNEMVRMTIPVLTLWLSLMIDPTELRKVLVFFFRVGTPFIVLFAVVQYLAPEAIPSQVLNAYGGSAHIRALLTRARPRIFATGSDPNVGGVILSLFFFYYGARFFLKKRLHDGLVSIVFIVLVALTASRTVVVGLVVNLGLVMLFSRRLGLEKKIALLLVAGILFGLIWTRIDYIRIGFSTLLQGENNSWLSRLSHFREAFNLFRRSPFFGWGPAKALHGTIVDGEYFMLLRRYGLLGFGVAITFMLNVSYGTYRAIRTTYICLDDENIALTITFLFYSSLMFVTMITNSFFTGYQLTVPYMILLGYTERSIKTHPIPQ